MINRKVGIMGGSFNPIHQGHLVVANEVLNIYNFDKIIFVPAGIPPHKNGLKTNPWDRYIMTQIATVSNDRFAVSDIEVKRTGKSYTLETLIQFQEMYTDTEFYFITGTDAIIDIPNWHEPEKLLSLCKFIAVSRPGIDKEIIEKKIKEIKDTLNGHIELMQVPMLQISSTDIRERIKKGVSAKYLLPETVEQYIIKNNLYR
ncbi:nicotinate-nucleotide adenylyltransferase [Sedimentibacter sp.]|uniref:nicotinate-nucleotide adenylyltransferase n=1 Tax=Sedimentibacter sp. TaxID=1960295 RepID=UPI0028A152E6|nr:nicotinate-nucleotide adenylyltransferase [Sedimentibacter sp.]